MAVEYSPRMANPLFSDREVSFQLYEVHGADDLCRLPAFAAVSWSAPPRTRSTAHFQSASCSGEVRADQEESGRDRAAASLMHQ